MKYAIRQSHWQCGIEIPKRGDDPADADTYQSVYARQRGLGYTTDPGWLAAKQKQAEIFLPLLKDQQPVLSVGAGLGVIEKHLSEAGIRIDLQECQRESLNWFRQNAAHAAETTFYEDADLSQIPSASYAAILCCSVVYAFSDGNYDNFLRQCRRILLPGGTLIIWDHDAHLPLHLIKAFFRKSSGRKWGWIRTPDAHLARAQRAGFSLLGSSFYDLSLIPLRRLPLRFFGLQSRRGASHAQMHVFKSQ